MHEVQSSGPIGVVLGLSIPNIADVRSCATKLQHKKWQENVTQKESQNVLQKVVSDYFVACCAHVSKGILVYLAVVGWGRFAAPFCWSFCWSRVVVCRLALFVSNRVKKRCLFVD